MAETTLGFSTAIGSRSAVGALQLDAMVSEQTELRARATQFPVEDGSTISDNVSVDPEKLSISGVVTAAPAARDDLDGHPASGRAGLGVITQAPGCRASEARIPGA